MKFKLREFEGSALAGKLSKPHSWSLVSFSFKLGNNIWGPFPETILFVSHIYIAFDDSVSKWLLRFSFISTEELQCPCLRKYAYTPENVDIKIIFRQVANPLEAWDVYSQDSTSHLFSHFLAERLCRCSGFTRWSVFGDCTDCLGSLGKPVMLKGDPTLQNPFCTFKLIIEAVLQPW